jgi:hypothetical protein
MKGSAVIIDQGETLGYGKGLGPLNERASSPSRDRP